MVGDLSDGAFFRRSTYYRPGTRSFESAAPEGVWFSRASLLHTHSFRMTIHVALSLSIAAAQMQPCSQPTKRSEGHPATLSVPVGLVCFRDANVVCASGQRAACTSFQRAIRSKRRTELVGKVSQVQSTQDKQTEYSSVIRQQGESLARTRAVC
jgi:hypothetical protein